MTLAAAIAFSCPKVNFQLSETARDLFRRYRHVGVGQSH